MWVMNLLEGCTRNFVQRYPMLIFCLTDRLAPRYATIIKSEMKLIESRHFIFMVAYESEVLSIIKRVAAAAP
jgi:hypothetical protein